MEYNFDDIRCYNDDEYHKVVTELLQEEPFVKAIQFYMPDLTIEELTLKLSSFNTIQDFQSVMAFGVIRGIIKHSVDEFSYDGVNDLDPEKSYLLMSNHRDIVLDSTFVNYCLNDQQYNTCEIAIGSNLLSRPWIEKLVRLNKSFIVKRNLPKHDMLEASKTLSAYIKHTLQNKKQSVWIAQREGRAKDGNDKTTPGLLKMFGMSKEADLLDYIKSLNITPISISYEVDPCDHLKIPELLAKEKEEAYVKTDGEDDMHMLLGIQGHKGRVHVQFTTPINEEIEKLRDIKNRNELLKEVALVIDRSIYRSYKLWDSNYVAYDLLNNSTQFEASYTEESKAKFVKYINSRLEKYQGNDNAKKLFLQMYANPVVNKLAHAG